MICTYYLSDGVSMVTETSGTRTGTLDSEYENIGIIPIYFVLHWLLGANLVHSGANEVQRGANTMPQGT
jgi:hypothetical protein